jgi:hypothetical protein
MLIIKAILNHGDLGSNSLSTILARTQCLVSSFGKITFFHIKQELNSSAGRWDELASHLNEVILVKNGIISSNPIPYPNWSPTSHITYFKEQPWDIRNIQEGVPYCSHVRIEGWFDLILIAICVKGI